MIVGAIALAVVCAYLTTLTTVVATAAATCDTTLAIAWNGLLGKGYKVVFQLPPFDTNKGKLIRALMLVYVAVGTYVLFIS